MKSSIDHDHFRTVWMCFQVERIWYSSRFWYSDFIVRQTGDLQARYLQTEDIGKGQNVKVFTVHLLIIRGICHWESWNLPQWLCYPGKVISGGNCVASFHFILSFLTCSLKKKKATVFTFEKQRKKKEICLRLGTPDCSIQKNSSRGNGGGIVEIWLLKHIFSFTSSKQGLSCFFNWF